MVFLFSYNAVLKYVEMKEPIEPSKEDCCNSGCDPCIFDVYHKQLLLYKKCQENGQIPQNTITENAISQIKYTPFVVLDNVKLSEEHYLIIFKVKCNNDTITWKPGNHFLIKYTSSENNYSRAYTPLKYMLKRPSEFSVLVKRYNQGNVSNYLCDLKVGEETLWRGPYGVYEIQPNHFDRIILIAQGTGIAPMFSIIQNILGDEEYMTKLVLLYCCASKDLILFREELYSWRQYWNFTYTIYLSHGYGNDVLKYQEPIINHKLDANILLQIMPCSNRDQFLICGSKKFMSYYKGFLETEKSENIVIF